MKVADVVKDALLLLRVIDKEDAPEDADARDAIRALNRMMRAWEVDGLPLGWSDVSTVQDDLPAPPEAEEAIVYNLALRLAGQFGRAVGADVVTLANDGLATLRAQVASNDYARCRYDDLPLGTGQRGGSWRDGFNS